MRKIYLFICLLSLAFKMQAQVLASNYTFTTNATGSLTDMSSGTTTVFGPKQFSTFSNFYPIGFDFWFMGTRQNLFNVTSHGLVGFGNILTTGINLAGGISNRIGPFIAGNASNNPDMGTGCSGKVHFKVIGVAPNRVLVVEWLNMSLPRTSGTADATFQARFYETLNDIEFVYGSMSISAGLNTAVQYRAGFSTTTSIFQSITFASHTSSTATLGNNLFPSAGPITALTSVADGARRTYRFSQATTPVAPTGFTPGSIRSGQVQLSFTPPATAPSGYAFFAATNIAGPYNYLGNINGVPSFPVTITGLTANTPNYIKIYSFSESKLSATSLDGTITTSAPLAITSAASGNWGDAATWTGGLVPTSGDNVTIATGQTVTVNTPAQSGNLDVAGTITFDITTSNNMSVFGNLNVLSGGTYNSLNGTSGRQLNLYGNFNNQGACDFSKTVAGNPATINCVGTTPQTLSSTGSFVGTDGTGTPANTGVVRIIGVNNPQGVTLNFPLIVNVGLLLIDGPFNVGTNKLYVDNTQNFPGGSSIVQTTISRYNNFGQIVGTPVFGINSSIALNYLGTISTVYPQTSLTPGPEMPANNTIASLGLQNQKGLIVNTDLTIKSGLTLNVGNLIMGNKNLTLGTSAAIPGTLGYNSGFVNTTGTITRWFGTTAITLGASAGQFPFGEGDENRSYWIGGTPSVGGTMTVAHVTTAGNNAISPSFAENAITYDNRSNMNWVVSTASGLTGTGLSARAQANGLQGVTNVAQLNMSLVNGAIPATTYSAGTLNTCEPQVNRTNMSATDLNNTFYVASNAAVNPLPLKLIAFVGMLNKQDAILIWKTENESNLAGFEIERLIDGKNEWKLVNSRVGANNTNGANAYQMTDANLAFGKYQYRLKMIDRDGKYTYSKIVTLVVNGTGYALLGNYPNPANTFTSIRYQLAAQGKVNIDLFAADGRKLATLLNEMQNAGVQNLDLQLAKYQLANGNYIYRIAVTDENGQTLFTDRRMLTVLK
jgi:hypothetical protein